MSKLSRYGMDGKPSGDFDVPEGILVYDKGAQAVQEAIVAHRTNRRAGTASTLSKGEVAGSNKKPWKQKGLGRARAGSKGSPIWRGGGVVFGPKPRHFHKKINKKTAKLAFRRAFSERIASGEVAVLDQLQLTTPKTKAFVDMVRRLAGDQTTLFVVDQVEVNLQLASRNIPRVEIATASGVNTFQMMRYKKVFVTAAAMEILTERLTPAARRSASE